MADSKEMKAGDVVNLKSGGPPMTITAINKSFKGEPQSATCVWFDGSKKNQDIFDLATLEPYSPGGLL